MASVSTAGNSKPKLSRAERNDEVKRRLFDAAAKVVGHLGYAEASVARLASEPRVSDERLTAMRQLLANSHRLVLAVMSLEGGLARSAPAPVRESFRTFSQGVVTTLSRLADALRGKPLDKTALPDLREVHGELVRAGDPHFGRHALVNVETDRMVNSLNTLCELVAKSQPAP